MIKRGGSTSWVSFVLFSQLKDLNLLAPRGLSDLIVAFTSRSNCSNGSRLTADVYFD